MICDKCGTDKPNTNFPVRNRYLQNGQKERHKTCRSCKRKQNKINGLCQCGKPLETKTLCSECRNRINKRSREYAKELKLKAINIYGNKCAFCHEDREIFLTIDHINDNGAEHRKTENISTGSKTYKWLKRNNYPSGFQVACFNCNAAKAIIGINELLKIVKPS